MPDIYYKALGPKAKCIDGKGSWHRPHGARPGKWMPRLTGTLVHYEHGYHVVGRDHLVEWLSPELYEVEVREIELRVDGKIICRQGRLVRRLTNWTERTARLFACDCAARALRRTKCKDKRLWAAVRIARLFAHGQSTEQELDDAMSAAMSAAGYAARYDAWSAAMSASWSAAWSAAEAASWSAAMSATEDAARLAAGYAERKWQTKRLFEYLDGKRG